MLAEESGRALAVDERCAGRAGRAEARIGFGATLPVPHSGRGDGAEAFRTDSPKARIELLDGGHFLLEAHVDEVAALMREFLSSVLPTTGAKVSFDLSDASVMVRDQAQIALRLVG